jgi:aromatic ring-opening dioxygenase LigB subunit
MPLVGAVIAPHGYPIIPELSDDAEGALRTREAMVEVGSFVGSTNPDVLVLAGPHGMRVDGAICLANVARAAGTLEWHGRTVEMNVPCARGVALQIADACVQTGVPVALASYAGNRPDQSVAPLDWGAMTPLWFFGHGRHLSGLGNVLAAAPPEDIGPPVVLVTPSRLVPRERMIVFGEAVAQVAEASDKRIFFVASCDWGHTHAADGPYGFHEAAAIVDARVTAAVESNSLESLIGLTTQEVEDAAIDGLWQTLMLAGVQRRVPMNSRLVSYEAPTYYGMMVAAFTRIDEPSAVDA